MQVAPSRLFAIGLVTAGLAGLSGCTVTGSVSPVGDSPPAGDDGSNPPGDTPPATSDPGTKTPPVSGTWEKMTIAAIWEVSDIWVSGPKDVHAIASGNGAVQILHFDGATWTDPTYSGIAYELFGTSTGSVFAFGEDLFARSGSQWAPFSQPQGAGGAEVIDSLWGTSDSNLYALTGFGIRHFDGASWSASVPGLESASFDFTDSFFGTSATDVWYSDHNASGEPSRTPKLFHYDGKAWRDVWADVPSDVKTGSTNQGVYGMFGSAKDDVWALSGGRTVVHFDGAKWATVSGPSDWACDLARGWSSAKNNAWLVGKGGCVFHWDGTAWTNIPSGTTLDLYKVRGSDARNVWIAPSSKDTLLRLKPST